MGSTSEQAGAEFATGKTASGQQLESLRIRVKHATRQAESKIIRETLDQHHWNRRRTAEALRISYRSLMYKMKACNLRDAATAVDAPHS